MISKTTIIYCALLGSGVLSARLDNLYGAPAPPGASRGSGGDGNFLNAPAPSNQYLPPTGQASNQGGYPSVAPLGGQGGQAQNQFGYNPQQQQQPQRPQQSFGGSYGAPSGGGQPGIGGGAGGFQGGFQQPRTTPIPILRYENVNNGDGSYRFE